jgi:hypothetical protein
MRYSQLILLLMLTLLDAMFQSAAYAQSCEEIADQQARIAYHDVYSRVLGDCRAGQPSMCRSDYDCLVDQRCVSGRCVARPETCVTRCAARYPNGECRQYDADYCGIDPQCTQHCVSRYPNGECREYGPDLCGRRPLTCVEKCETRYPNGSCRAYGQDYCGASPVCTPHCVSRYPNGECRDYGTDRCSG